MQAQTYETVVFNPNLYADHCELAWASTTTLTVASGAVRDSLNMLDINVASTLTLNSALSGLGGLDTGTVANTTVYFVFIVADTQGFNAPALLMSTSSTAPVMPYGYSALRRIGRVRTDGSAHFLKFYAEGTGLQRFIQFDTPLSILSGGSSTTFAAVDTLLGVANSSTVPVYLDVTYTPNTAASVASIRPTGSSAASLSCPVELKGNVSAVSFKLPMIKVLPLVSSGTSSIDYLVTASDSLSLSVAAFDERL